MSSDSEGKKVPLYPLLSRPSRPERKHSPLNPYYVEMNHKRSTSGSLPPGLLRLMRAYDDEEDSDCGTPPLLLPSIDVHKVSYSESDSETGAKSHLNSPSPSSSLFIHATPPRINRIKETDSDATTLNELSRFIIRRPPNDQVKNRDLFHSTCSLPELPKWLNAITDGYSSEGRESKKKSSRRRKGIFFGFIIEGNEKSTLSDVFSDLFLASENRAFHSIISNSRQAKCFYWKKRKPDKWIRFNRSKKRLDQTFHPFKVKHRHTDKVDSFSLLNSPTCASPTIDPTEEDYEAADDASVASSGGFDSANLSFSNRLFGLNISGSRHAKSRTSTNNSNLKRLFSDGELLTEKVSFKNSLIDAKNLCDSQLGTVYAEIVAVLNGENDTSAGIMLIRKYLDEESISILKQLSLFIQKILSVSCDELLIPNTIQRIIEELQTIQSNLSDKRNGATGWFGIQTSMAISGVLNILEHGQDEPCLFAKGGFESDSDSNHNGKGDFFLNLEWENKQIGRILLRPSFSRLPNMGGIKQNDWTIKELQDVAEEGQLLNIVIVFLRSGEISYISPSVTSVFGICIFLKI